MAAVLGQTISTCSRKHAATWQRAAPNILRFIEAQNYLVIVPDDEIGLFRRITPGAIDIAAESAVAGRIAPALHAAMQSNTDRFGWYLQQLTKLAALMAIDSVTALIWDADTIPLRPLSFEGATGQLRYYTSDERHDPYFEAIERLFGRSPTHSASFIAQCFPIRVAWAREFAAVLEAAWGIRWYEAFIAAIDFDARSGFSEYETLGTYLLRAHAADIAFNPNPWLRNGTSTTGGVELFDTAAEVELAAQFDYVAFELWDTPVRRLKRPGRWLRR